MRAAGSKPFFNQLAARVTIISWSANCKMGAFVCWNWATFAAVLADFERLTSTGIGAVCLNCLSLRTREWELPDIQLWGCFWIKRIWNAELAKVLRGITLIECGAAFAS